jgi:hypothetical protein
VCQCVPRAFGLCIIDHQEEGAGRKKQTIVVIQQLATAGKETVKKQIMMAMTCNNTLWSYGQGTDPVSSFPLKIINEW